MNLKSRTIIRIKVRLRELRKSCSEINNQQAAAAIVAGACMGVVPLLGFTLILVTAYSVLFKTNFIIMQVVHLLVTPLQLLLLYPFLRTGQWLLHNQMILPPVEKLQLSYLIEHFDTMSLFVLKLLIGGTLAWLIAMLFCAPVLYKIAIRLLNKQIPGVPAR